MCAFFFFSVNTIVCRTVYHPVPRKAAVLSGIHAKKKTTTLAGRSTFSQLVKLGKWWVFPRLLKSINQISWQHVSAKSQQEKQMHLQKDRIDTNGIFLFSSHGYIGTLDNKKVELIFFNTARDTFRNKQYYPSIPLISKQDR